MKNLVFLFAFLCVGAIPAIAQKTFEGEIVSRNGSNLQLKAPNVSELPTKSENCNISKDISGTSVFGIKLDSGWMGIGTIKYVGSKEGILIFEIVEETSKIEVNGKKTEQFEKGKKVKVEC